MQALTFWKTIDLGSARPGLAF